MGSRRVRHNWVTSLSLFTFHFRALEKEMATHSSVLAWRIPGTEETGGLPSIGSHRVRHNWSDLAAAAVANLYLTFCEPMHYSLPGSSVHGILPARILKWVAIFFPEDLPNPGIKPTSPTWQVDSLLWVTWESQILEETRLRKQRKLMWRNMIKL